MATRVIGIANEGGFKYEFGEYSSGTFGKTFAIPTSLRTCVFATGAYEGSDLYTGAKACATSCNQTVTNFSICSNAGQYYLDFSLADVSTGISPNCLAYFAVGY